MPEDNGDNKKAAFATAEQPAQEQPKQPPAAPAPAPQDEPADERLLRPVGVAMAPSFVYPDVSGLFVPYNPDALMTTKGRTIYRKMMADDQVKAVMLFKRHAVTSRSWHFEKDPENKDHEKMADVFNAAVDQMNGAFSDVLDNMLTALSYGFSISEKTFKSIEWDGRPWWGIDQIVLLPYDTFLDRSFVTDRHGNIERVVQRVIIPGMTWEQQERDAPGGLDIPVDKIVHFVNQPGVHPVFGESDLRSAYRPWWSKDNVIKFQNIFLERHAAGFFWAEFENNSIVTNNPAEMAKLKKALTSVMAHTGMIVPQGVKINHSQPVNTSAYESAIAGYDKSIAKGALVPNLLGMSEQGKTGSYAQSQTQEEVFFWVVDAITNRLEETLNNQLFSQLATWNFATAAFPPFRFDPMSESEKRALAAAWADLIQKGAVTRSDEDEDHTRELLGYPAKPEGVLGANDPNNPTNPNSPTAIKAKADAAAEAAKGKADPEAQAEEAQAQAEQAKRNAAWADSLPGERRAYVLREFREKPWTRRVDFARIKTELDRADEKFAQELADLMAQAHKQIDDQVGRIVGQRSLGHVKPAELKGIHILKKTKSEIRRTVRDNLLATLHAQHKIARAELPARRKMADAEPKMDMMRAESFLSARAMKIAGVLDQDVLQAVNQELETAMKYDKTLKETIAALEENTALLQVLPEYDAAGRAVNVPARLENIVRTNTATAMNEARQAFFEDEEFRGWVRAFQYSAILDDRTTDLCEALGTRGAHGGVVRKDFANWTPPNHFQCRSLLVPVTQLDEWWDGEEDPLPTDLAPQKGFMSADDRGDLHSHGDVAGHEFHGNQWTEGGGGAGGEFRPKDGMTFDHPSDGTTVQIERRGSGWYGKSEDFDFEAKDDKELYDKLKGWGYKTEWSGIEKGGQPEAGNKHGVKAGDRGRYGKVVAVGERSHVEAEQITKTGVDYKGVRTRGATTTVFHHVASGSGKSMGAYHVKADALRALRGGRYGRRDYGDEPGHPFRGNQWTEGAGGGAGAGAAAVSRSADRATSLAAKTDSMEDHMVAAALHDAASRAHLEAAGSAPDEEAQMEHEAESQNHTEAAGDEERQAVALAAKASAEANDLSWHYAGVKGGGSAKGSRAVDLTQLAHVETTSPRGMSAHAVSLHQRAATAHANAAKMPIHGDERNAIHAKLADMHREIADAWKQSKKFGRKDYIFIPPASLAEAAAAVDYLEEALEAGEITEEKFAEHMTEVRRVAADA